ncbi:MAG: glycosyltransferase [Hyphomicrobium sp.]|nr:glycosyltransferase [Hyphomicrobium sp.]
MQAANGQLANGGLVLEDPTKPLPFSEKWSFTVLAQIFLFWSICFIFLEVVPNSIWDASNREIMYVIGLLGIWRYLWWFNHFMRALVFEKITYPKMRDRAAALWASGWRPRHIHIQMTTFREHREISEAVIRALAEEIREAGVPATIWLGSSEASDEQKIARHLKLVASDLDITLRIIRQNQPGKRVAIALILRAMSREGLGKNDLVIFMDGDFVLHPGAMRRCFPLFAFDPELHALTTDEYVLVKGPRWMQTWLDMRFSQRRLAMQSHALSNRVLTLTGRFSVFRATHITSHEFIRLQEADYLNHWLWGTFRFLSGDDKSTWYTLLKHGVKMTYVPDAAGTTIEVVEGSGVTRMVENLRRWSGNMLRNGQRAIQLGPRRMPFFIWWCCVDQRLAMWTMLFSPMLAFAGTVKMGTSFLAAYVVYIAITRGMLSMVLFRYARRVDLGYVWTLYANQLLNAAVKVYMMWRLAKQKWSNRGNQKQGFTGDAWIVRFREAMAAWLTTLSFVSLLVVVVIYTGLIKAPSLGFIQVMVLG